MQHQLSPGTTQTVPGDNPNSQTVPGPGTFIFSMEGPLGLCSGGRPDCDRQREPGHRKCSACRKFFQRRHKPKDVSTPAEAGTEPQPRPASRPAAPPLAGEGFLALLAQAAAEGATIALARVHDAGFILQQGVRAPGPRSPAHPPQSSPSVQGAWLHAPVLSPAAKHEAAAGPELRRQR